MGPLLGKESRDFLMGDLFGYMVGFGTLLEFFLLFLSVSNKLEYVSKSVKTCMRLGL